MAGKHSCERSLQIELGSSASKIVLRLFTADVNRFQPPVKNFATNLSSYPLLNSC